MTKQVRPSLHPLGQELSGLQEKSSDFPEWGLFGHASALPADTDLQCVPAPRTGTPRGGGEVLIYRQHL